ncbi:MAG: YbgF trimerization domain-containing protein, partial [Alphaproteobacteria bacterium]
MLAVALGAGVARAQTGDMRPLFDRMDRLERDLNLLQRQVYRGAVEGGELAMPAGESAAAAPSNAVTGMEVRINQLESEMRALTGRVEESNHAVDQLKDRLDKLVTDVDNRLVVLEQEAAKNKALVAVQPTAPA